MYWIWANELDDENEAMIYGVPAIIESEDLRFDEGVRIEREISLIEIIRDEDSQGLLTDNLIAPGVSGLLLSSRIRNSFELIGIDNIDYYHCRITNPIDNTYSDDYLIANIVGKIECIDREKSDLIMHSHYKDEIEFINSLILKEDVIKNLKIFRLQENTEIIVVHESVRDMCVKERFTGIKFYKPEDFVM